jgi:uncharacterized protein YlxW (UPF0749 family)
MSIFSVNISHRSFWWQISALCFVLGILLAAAVNTTGQLSRTGGAFERIGFFNPAANRTQETATKMRSDESEIKKLRDRSTDLENKLAKRQDASEALNKDLQEAKFVAGLTEADGPGIQVTLTDSQRRPVDSTPNGMLVLLIHDEDIERVINELRAAGAEAIAVNGQRVISLTAIRCAGPVVQVNGVPTTPPVVIQAIGDPDTMFNALNMRDGVLDVMRRFDPAMAKADKMRMLHLPAYAGSTTFRYAYPPKHTHKEDSR